MSRPERPRFTMKLSSRAVGSAAAVLGLASLFLGVYFPGQKIAVAALGLAGAAGLIYFFVAERGVLGRAAGSRSARYGANAAALTLAFLGILVLANVLAARHNKKWDLTAGKLHTLSEQSRKVVRGLAAPVTVTGFFQDGSEPREQMRRLLRSYQDESPQFQVTFVDPDRSPELARQAGIREYGTTVFASGSQTYRVSQASEEAVTNALVRVTRKGKKTVYFLSGHGEHSIDDTQRTGLSSAKKALEDQGFAPQDLLLLRQGEVPKDCDVLVVAGPSKPLLEQEVKAVRAYLDRGGRVFLMIDPMSQTGLEGLLAEWGAVLRNDVIIDPMSRLFGGSYTTPILSEYPPHELTRDFRVATFLPLARSLEAAKPLPKGVTYAPIARTSPQAWGETNLKDESARFDAGTDVMGPLTAAGLFEKREVFASGDAKAAAQLLVFGDSDFADNTYFNFSGNGDLFQNAVSYLAKEQDLISVRPKDSKPSPLSLTRAQAATLFYGTVVVAPLATILAGLSIWWRRRNL